MYLQRLKARPQYELRKAAKAPGKMVMLRPDVVEREPDEPSAPIAVKPAPQIMFIHTPLAITVPHPRTTDSVLVDNIVTPMRC